MKYIILLIALSMSVPVLANDNTSGGGGGGACIVCGGPVTFFGSGPGGYSNSSPIEYPLQRKLPFSIFTVWEQKNK